MNIKKIVNKKNKENVTKMSLKLNCDEKIIMSFAEFNYTNEEGIVEIVTLNEKTIGEYLNGKIKDFGEYEKEDLIGFTKDSYIPFGNIRPMNLSWETYFHEIPVVVNIKTKKVKHYADFKSYIVI